MPEKIVKKQASYAIYKIAAELNISKEHLLDYLKKKKVDVKNHMSKVDDDVYQDILQHFKKDKDIAEKHYRKVTEFRRKQKEIQEKVVGKTKIELEVLEEKEELKYSITEFEKPEKPVEQILESTEIEIPTISEIKPITPPTQELDKKQQTAETITEETPTEVIQIEDKVDKEAEKLPTQEKVIEIAETSLKAAKAKTKGLKIVGKIDLKAGEIFDEITEDEKRKIDLEEPVETKVKKVKRPKKKRLREELKKVKIEKEITKTKKIKRLKGKDIDEKEVDEAIRRTMESMDIASAFAARSATRRKKKKERLEEKKSIIEEIEKQKKILRMTEFVTVSELAKLMNVSVAEVITKCMSFGLMVSINQRLNKDTITLVADDFGYEVSFHEEYASSFLYDPVDDEKSLVTRPPVVTIMGHVDHGKTSLLDYIRNSQIVAGEAGGITQHIGAYKVVLDSGKEITFLDTPGHEAFTAMRARGAQVTDIVILVVAADDSVMPQTIEAINHAQAAGVPIIIAVNKIDKPTANPERIRQQLSEKNVLVEEWGGKYQSVEISAKTGKNIDLLLEKVLLEADVLDLKANPNRKARGVMIEVELDKGKGIVGTVLIQKGKLRIGDPFVAGVSSGRVRAMLDERGRKIEEALPSTPVQILGFDEMPQAGDELIVVDSDKAAREISIERLQIKREQSHRLVRHLTLDEISKQIQIGGVKDLFIIVKGDVDGSVEALADSLLKLSTKEVRVQVIHKGVGAIVESDVLLAAASQAVIIGFHVRPNLNARKLAETEQVEIRLYNIIYDAINDIKSAVEGMLSPEVSEEITSTIDVREVFKISRIGTIAGCYVQDGKIQRNNKIRLIRDGIVIYDGTIETLKRFKDDMREVEAGKECGIKIENFNDVKVGDIIEGYKVIEKKRTLENVSKN